MNHKDYKNDWGMKLNEPQKHKSDDRIPGSKQSVQGYILPTPGFEERTFDSEIK